MCIPRKTVRAKKSTHPWLTDEVMKLVAQKQLAEGTEGERAAREKCSAGIVEQYHKYIARERRQLQTMRGASKAW